ncbi:uroporphyrinogen-III C-methyltransferase [Pseudoneobacillus sp. C159]
MSMEKGKVYLVGAGPGDVGLITVKGLEAIQKAQVILYDRLANPKLLQYAAPTCEFIYCGKLPDRHTLRQERINDLLVQKALEGKIVVRLKGGDPGVFGRVGEEAEALAAFGIPFELVPGISSGIAAPLYAGIPVTHREYGESFAVVTAHDKSKDGQPSIDWKGLVSGVATIAFYMGIGNLPFICENLMENGKSPETPVILIQWGTFGRQKTLEGTLATISKMAKQEGFSNPAITLVGDIISLRQKLSWFEKKPLFGRQILLARSGTEWSELAKVLADEGADVYEFPRWKKVKAPVNRTILSQLSHYESVLFTSSESVDEFFTVLIEQNLDIRLLKAKLYGASTKSEAALRKRGFFVEDQAALDKAGRVLIVADRENAGEEFPDADVFMTSFKQIDEAFYPIFRHMLEDATIDTIIFPSSVAVAPFLQEMNKGFQQAIGMADIICMGEKTYQAAVTNGLKPIGIPTLPTTCALLEFLKEKRGRA